VRLTRLAADPSNGITRQTPGARRAMHVTLPTPPARYHRLVDFFKDGARTLFGGARKGNTPLVGLGAAMMALGWARKLYRNDRELIYSRTLKKGQAIRIRLLDADDPVEGEIEIEG